MIPLLISPQHERVLPLHQPLEMWWHPVRPMMALCSNHRSKTKKYYMLILYQSCDTCTINDFLVQGLREEGSCLHLEYLQKV